MSTSKKSGGHSYCCTQCNCFKTSAAGTKRLSRKGAPTAPGASSCNGSACGEYAIDTLSSNGQVFTIIEISTDINPSCNPKISSDKEKQLKEELSERLKNAVYARISQLVDSQSGYWLEKGMIFKGCFDFEAIVCKDDMNITETPLHTFGRA
jgi:hypothetical protein